MSKKPFIPTPEQMVGISKAYTWLYYYYVENHNKKTPDEIRARLTYLTKNKVKQMGEVETLRWVLGESVHEEDNI